MCDRGGSGCFFFHKVIRAFSFSLAFPRSFFSLTHLSPPHSPSLSFSHTLSLSHSVALLSSSSTYRLLALRAPFRPARRSRETGSARERVRSGEKTSTVLTSDDSRTHGTAATGRRDSVRLAGWDRKTKREDGARCTGVVGCRQEGRPGAPGAGAAGERKGLQVGRGGVDVLAVTLRSDVRHHRVARPGHMPSRGAFSSFVHILPLRDHPGEWSGSASTGGWARSSLRAVQASTSPDVIPSLRIRFRNREQFSVFGNPYSRIRANRFARSSYAFRDGARFSGRLLTKFLTETDEGPIERITILKCEDLRVAVLV